MCHGLEVAYNKIDETGNIIQSLVHINVQRCRCKLPKFLYIRWTLDKELRKCFNCLNSKHRYTWSYVEVTECTCKAATMIWSDVHTLTDSPLPPYPVYGCISIAEMNFTPPSIHIIWSPAAHPCPAVHLLVSRPEPVAPTLICQVEKS